jgi:acetate kinase
VKESKGKVLLTVNVGSSSVRLALFSNKERQPAEIKSHKYSFHLGKPVELLNSFLEDHSQKKLKVIAHRIVHGGRNLVEPQIIDSHVEAEILHLSPLAPLHNKLALEWIQACRTAIGQHVPQVAVFDTAFFAYLPTVAKTYAIPGELAQKYGIERYGFHGIAHRAIWERWRKIHPEIEDGGRIITLQLGSGSSIAAIKDGLPVDTSMGFSPLEGLVMSTRPGDLDPGLVTYLQRSLKASVDEIERLLNQSSGLLGVSGFSGDMQTLLNSEDSRARLAVELYCYRAKKYVGAYLAALGGVHGILFGGGVGENSAEIRLRILENMEWCGIELDKKLNSTDNDKDYQVSSKESKIEVWVVNVDESHIIAREAISILNSKKEGGTWKS